MNKKKVKQYLAKNYIELINFLNKPIKTNALKGCLVIINFHQVSDTFTVGIHNKGTWTPTNIFRSTIESIHKKYGFVSLPEGINYLRNNEIGKETLFSLTFDDGDNFLQEKVIPFLTKKRIPATFFINTKYLDNQSTNWARAYSYLLSIDHKIFKEKKNIKNTFLEIRNTNNPIIYNKNRRLLEDCFRQLDEKPKFKLDLEYLKQMDKNLFKFGLHGHEHQRYSMLSYEEQKIDIEKNIEKLSEFENYLPYWALPFGTYKDWNRDTIKIAIEKELLLLFHTNSVNYIWNNLGVDRIPCDSKNFYDIIIRIRK